MPPSDYKQITYEQHDRVARIVLNRPRYRNAQSRILLEELDHAFGYAAEDDSIGAIVLAGAGDHFSAGHDLGTPEEMANAAAQIEGAKLHFLEGADHGFAVLKRSGRTKEEIYQEAVAELLTFVQERGIA